MSLVPIIKGIKYVPKPNESVEKVGSRADLFAVTIPCCANERCRRNATDDGTTTTDRVAVLLLPLRRPNSRGPSATADRSSCGSQLRTGTFEELLQFDWSPLD